MTTATEQRRDRAGRFVRECFEDGCTTRAQWGVEGYGFYGIANGHSANRCKRHAEAAARRMNRAGQRHGMSGKGYRAVKVEDR